jgi:hypothetical protein
VHRALERCTVIDLPWIRLRRGRRLPSWGPLWRLARRCASSLRVMRVHNEVWFDGHAASELIATCPRVQRLDVLHCSVPPAMIAAALREWKLRELRVASVGDMSSDFFDELADEGCLQSLETLSLQSVAHLLYSTSSTRSSL